MPCLDERLAYSQFTSPNILTEPAGKPRSEPLQSVSHVRCPSSRLLLMLGTQLRPSPTPHCTGLTSTYPSIRRHHFIGEGFQSCKVLFCIPRAASTSLTTLHCTAATPRPETPVRLQACTPVPTARLAPGRCSGGESRKGHALSTPPQRASHLNTVLAMNPETNIRVQGVY